MARTQPEHGNISRHGHRGLVRDAARVRVHLEADVAVLAPGRRPGVAHDPVGLLARRVVADELDAVVDVRVGAGARVVPQHSARIIVPGARVDADGRGRRLDCLRELAQILVGAEALAAGVRCEGVALNLCGNQPVSWDVPTKL